MSLLEPDFAALARAMQNFFDAVDWRTEVTVQSAAAEAEVLYGAEAALEAIIRACGHLREEEHEDCRFWMKVYGVLVAPELASGGHVTLH